MTILQGNYLRADAPQPLVTGAFIQFSEESVKSSASWWKKQLSAMSAIGIDTVIVQYAASNERYYYPSKEGEKVSDASDAIQCVLDAAQQSRIAVYLGLHMDHHFWSNKFDVEVRLKHNEAILDELYSLYGNHVSLKGWYIPEEIDDLVAKKDYAEDLLKYFGRLSERAHKQTRLPVVISPFFGRDVDPAEYACWWDSTGLPAINIDILALQDGVGTHRNSVAQAISVYKALAPVARKHGVKFWANNESFDQTHGWPVDEQHWAAVPAAFPSFLSQVKATSPHVEKSITFEFTHYLDPDASERAKELYRAYRDYYEVARSAPSAREILPNTTPSRIP